MVANLSRHVQPVTIELGEFHGLNPVEVLGRAAFPAIGDDPQDKKYAGEKTRLEIG